MHCRAMLFVAFVAGLIPFAAHRATFGAERASSELELKTQRVIIFKDGYALVIKHAVATTDKSGEVYTDDVPDAAVLGSFWAIPADGKLVSMLAGWKTAKDSDDKQLPCTQIIEVLMANQGKRAKVELHDKTLYNGVIQQVLAEKTEAAVPPAQMELLDLGAEKSPAGTVLVDGIGTPISASALSATRHHALHVATPAEETTEHKLTSIAGTNFVLHTDEGDVLLPISEVRTLSIKDMKTTLAKTLTTSKKTKRLSFKFDKPNKKQELSIIYFRPGFRWIPTYRVSLNDAKEEKKIATIALQAELLNEAEDLTDVPVDIVVGVPNFRFRGVPSPLVLEATLRNALAEAAPDIMGQGQNFLNNSMYSQRASDFRAQQAHANAVAQGGIVDLPNELTAAGTQDLFVYKLPKITIAKGDRVGVPIFSTDVPYRDVYTWDVRITKQDNAAAPSGAGINSPLTLSKNEVWHQILLTNNTNLPWTTGAAMIMQGNQPLAQELLTYTPPKDEARVPVTVSVDTRGSLTEKETSRELKSIQWEGYNYAQINKEIKLDLCNNKPIEIEAEITLRVGGKIDSSKPEGEVTLGAFDPSDWVQYQGHPAVNNSSTAVWKTKLKPGEKFDPAVLYHYFTRH